MPGQSQAAGITVLLRRWQAGDAEAFSQVMEWAYQRILAIAAGFVARERLSTEPAALANEAYLRLRELRNMHWQDRHHFFSFVAMLLRRILVDQARLRIAQKREGALRRVPLTDEMSWIDVQGQDMIDLDRVLEELERLDERKARLIELRYIMGCTVQEIAELRDMSISGVERDLRFTRTWLYGKMREQIR